RLSVQTMESMPSEVKRYLPVVKSIAKKLQQTLSAPMELEKLIECGNVGLTNSIGDFRKRQGITMQTFSFYRIRGAMLEAMRNLSWPSKALFGGYLFQQKANQYLEWYSTSSDSFVKRSAAAEVEELNQLCQNLILISLLCRESAERSNSVEKPGE